MATRQENYQACMDTLRQQMHTIVDQLCNHALAAGLGGQHITEVEVKKPLNDLKPDPARSSITRRPSLIKTQVCCICGREMTLGNFRDRDNHLWDECNQCRAERTKEIKTKKNKAS